MEKRSFKRARAPESTDVLSFGPDLLSDCRHILKDIHDLPRNKEFYQKINGSEQLNNEINVFLAL